VYLIETYWLPRSLWLHEPAAMDRPSIMQGLLQCVEHEAGVCRAATHPASPTIPAGIGVDHKGDNRQSRSRSRT